MFRLYLSLAGSLSFITWVTMVTHVAMYEVTRTDLGCIDCDSTQVDIHVFVYGDSHSIEATCPDCEVTRTLVEGSHD
jgi:hypothetical protein